MALTDEERRRLGELAEQISRADPQLARALSRAPMRRSRLRRLAVVLMQVALPILLAGALVQQTLIVAIGCVALISGALVFLSARLNQHRAPHSARDD